MDNVLWAFWNVCEPKRHVSHVQRGYLSSRNTLLSSLFGEANNDNFGATMIWEWIAWNIDDRSYDFSVGQDGSTAQQAQINYMNSKVSACLLSWKSFPGATLNRRLGLQGKVNILAHAPWHGWPLGMHT